MNVVVFTPAQQDVIEFLENLPDATVINVRSEQQRVPGRHYTTAKVTISGGSHSDVRKCGECGHEHYQDHVSVSFGWVGGQFKKAEVWCGHRSHHKSIDDAKRTVDRLILRSRNQIAEAAS